jgi:hypothetical protein
MTVYLLNSLVVPVDLTTPKKIVMRRAGLTEVKKLLVPEFVSAIGHEGTAKLLTEILGGFPVDVNRISIKAVSGDVLIHFSLKQRLPEGKVLSKEELEKLEYEFVISEIYEVYEAEEVRE